MVPEIIREDTCIITKTVSKYPYVGKLHENCGVSVGGNGHGARGADEIGRLSANLMLNKKWDSPIAHETFKPILKQEFNLLPNNKNIVFLNLPLVCVNTI